MKIDSPLRLSVLLLSLLFLACNKPAAPTPTQSAAPPQLATPVAMPANPPKSGCYALKSAAGDELTLRFDSDSSGGVRGQFLQAFAGKDSQRGYIRGSFQQGNRLQATLSAYGEGVLYTTAVSFIIDAQQAQFGDSGGTVLQRVSCERRLSFKDYTLTIDNSGAGSLSQTSIKASRGGQAFREIRFETDGQLEHYYLIDSNHNGFPELYLSASSAGSGSYLHLYGYEFYAPQATDSSKPEQREIIWDEAIMGRLRGYRGHDSLYQIKPDTLTHVYPYYSEQSAYTDPAIGTGTFDYRLIERDGQLLLTINDGYTVLNNQTTAIIYSGPLQP